MKKIIYNKLVRDHIPQIIEKAGKTAVTEILSDEIYIEMLDKKLIEELEEYQESKEVEELADLMEVILAIAETRGFSRTDLEALREEKAHKRGGFSEKILLKEVIGNENRG